MCLYKLSFLSLSPAAEAIKYGANATFLFLTPSLAHPVTDGTMEAMLLMHALRSINPCKASKASPPNFLPAFSRACLHAIRHEYLLCSAHALCMWRTRAWQRVHSVHDCNAASEHEASPCYICYGVEPKDTRQLLRDRIDAMPLCALGAATTTGCGLADWGVVHSAWPKAWELASSKEARLLHFACICCALLVPGCVEYKSMHKEKVAQAFSSMHLHAERLVFLWRAFT